MVIWKGGDNHCFFLLFPINPGSNRLLRHVWIFKRAGRPSGISVSNMIYSLLAARKSVWKEE